MNILQRLLTNLGRLWNTEPSDISTLSIQRGTGTHTMVTVDAGVMYFHSITYRDDLPVKQSIVLDGMTLSDLITTINNMGYVSAFTSEASSNNLTTYYQGVILIEVQNVPLDATLSAFTSETWKLMYAQHRALTMAQSDMDTAIQQFTLPSSRGSWLDYWTGFLNFLRNVGEDDDTFLKRIYVYLYNPETNDIAIQELLRFRLGAPDITVSTTGPNVFEATVDPQYMSSGDDLHQIMADAKGAGINYHLNYQKAWSEDYEAYLADLIGRPFNQMPVLSQVIETSGYTETYATPIDSYSSAFEHDLTEAPWHIYNDSNFDTCFHLDSGDSKLDSTPTYDGKTVGDVATMTLTVSGRVIKSAPL